MLVSSARTALHLRRWWPFWAAFAAALILRFVDLGVRPFSHDEAINAAFLARVASGLPYVYNPAGYHGPLLYFAGCWPLWLLGSSEAALRLPVALASALMIPLLLPLRSRLGVAGVTGAAWLLALSPSLVYVGRDLIHETWLVVFTLAAVVAGSRWLETRGRLAFVLACGSLGLMVTVKETALLTLAGLAGAALIARVWAGGERVPRPDRPSLLLGGLAAVLPPVLLFTWFLERPRGLLDALRAPLLWSTVGVSGSGHTRPWTYFLQLLVELEPAALLAAAAGAWRAVRRRDRFGVFCAAWTAGQLVLYSAIPYKTPWLILNLVLPAALTAGLAVRELAAGHERRLLLALGLLALGWSGWRAVEVAWIRYDDERLELTFSHSRREVRSLVASVRAAAGRAPAGRPARIEVFVAQPWPLPWYFRGLPHVRRRNGIPPHPGGDILIVDTRQEEALHRGLHGSYARSTYPFRSGVTLAVYCARRLCPAGADVYSPPAIR